MIDAARAVIAALRLDRWSADDVTRRAHRALSRGVGGFVLFGGEADDVARLCAELRELAERPIWLAADLERGPGQQFAGCSQLPPPAALAAHPDPVQAVELAGTVTGREARRVGLNWVLAPVLDLDVEAENPIVSTRSFGPDPTRVTALGRAWIEACQGSGVAACAKHFPGHGRTRTDSHMELPVVDASREILQADLEPFRGVADCVASVMLGHVAYPALGGDRPATRSPEIVSDLLRRELGFGGLVVTDAMIMSGFGAEPARDAVDAVRAGCDLLLYPEDLDMTIRALAEAADQDATFERRLDEAIQRSEAHLAALPDDVVPGAGEPYSGWAADPEVLCALATATIVDRSAGELGEWDRHAATEVQVVLDDPEPGPVVGHPFGAAFTGHLQASGWNTSLAVDSSTSSDPTVQRIVLLQATPRGWKGRGGLSAEAHDAVHRALMEATRAFPIVFGHPRILEELDRAGACAWAVESVMESAAAEWLERAAGEARRSELET
jgi:beta-glucosidase